MKSYTTGRFNFLKWMTISSLLLGMHLHMSKFVFGSEATTTNLLTPAFEAFFIIPLTMTAFLQLYFIRRILFSNWIERIVYYFCTFQFVVSIPVHLVAAINANTDYVHSFPRYYSLFTTILWVFFIYVFVHLRLKEKTIVPVKTAFRRIHSAWFI